MLQVKAVAEQGPDGELAGAPPGYTLDPTSGYYFSTETGMFYDTASGGYFSSSSNKWYSFEPQSSQFVEWPVAADRNEEPVTGS